MFENGPRKITDVNALTGFVGPAARPTTPLPARLLKRQKSPWALKDWEVKLATIGLVLNYGCYAELDAG